MSDHKTILVIDDSSTIRRLVDSILSRDGYTVFLASDAETGFDMALEHCPDMILLDHQLPGTTGLEVCRLLSQETSVCEIPVVVSSTLRKKAYGEYGDMDNVVDMLPKPYSEELLLTTVSNALETGKMIVDSQSHGTAVPEVINAQADGELTGTFSGFTIREVLDFLNNGRKVGTLEVEADQRRYSIYIDNGRVVGITATGVPAEDVVDRLPDTLSELASVVNVTMGRGGAALDSIVDLLNSEVLDPRLLRRLLRHQAAVLLVHCFQEELRSFRFDTTKPVPGLFQRLPLEISVLALLVEGASTRTASEVPEVSSNAKFSRQPIRGQNLDRAGLTAQQSLLLGQLTSAKTQAELVAAVGGTAIEVRNVLHGLVLAELIECTDQTLEPLLEVVVYESETEVANSLNSAFAHSDRYKVTIVNDPVAAGLLTKRTVPSIVVVDASDEAIFTVIQQTVANTATKWIATGEREIAAAQITLRRPYNAAGLLDALDSVSNGGRYSKDQLATTTRPEAELCTI